MPRLHLDLRVRRRGEEVAALADPGVRECNIWPCAKFGFCGAVEGEEGSVDGRVGLVEEDRGRGGGRGRGDVGDGDVAAQRGEEEGGGQTNSWTQSELVNEVGVAAGGSS